MPILLPPSPPREDAEAFAQWKHDTAEFLAIYGHAIEALHEWIRLTGRDPHGGDDRPRYGYTEEGEVITSGPQFDPQFLAYLRERGRQDERRLRKGRPIYSEREAVATLKRGQVASVSKM